MSAYVHICTCMSIRAFCFATQTGLNDAWVHTYAGKQQCALSTDRSIFVSLTAQCALVPTQVFFKKSFSAVASSSHPSSAMASATACTMVSYVLLAP